MTPRRVGVAVLALVSLLAAWARLSARRRPELVMLDVPDRRVVRASDGVELHVEVDETGPGGPTVVLVHGFLARTAEFDAQWEHLRGRARVVRYDHRGHGRSIRDRASDLHVLASDLVAVVEEVAPTGPVVLVGHSMGGMVVLELARRHPELLGTRVRGVALISSGAGHDIPGHRVENAVRRLARAGALTPLLRLMRGCAPVAERLRPRGTWLLRRATRALLFGGADATRDQVAQAQRMLEEPPLATLTALQGAILRVDLRDALAELHRVPVTILTGADDRLISAEHSRAMARDVGDGAELVVLPGVGHAPTQTRPHEVNAALDRLLDRVQADALAG